VAGAICAFCRRQPVDERWRPFCSERCKLQDLAKWIDGAYRVPAEPLPDLDELADLERAGDAPVHETDDDG
jgi:endogenous inhibitor of DNA gyrase (YacG/DUF329 family)